MNKSVKKILLTLGIIISTSLLVAVIWILMDKMIYTLPNSILYVLTIIGSHLFIILPAVIFIFLKYKESKKKLSENQDILKSASIWAFVVMAFFRVMDLFVI
ncbi:MAG: hypothetical protein ABIF88_01440 [archaeon]